MAVGTDRHRVTWEPEVDGTVLTQQGRCQHGAIVLIYDMKFELLSVKAASLEVSRRRGAGAGRAG